EPRADRAYLRPLNVLRHDGEPIAVNHFRVVIQKEQPRIAGLLGGEIVDRGKVEWTAVIQDAMFRRREKSAGLVSLAVVVDNNDFIGRVDRLSLDALDATSEQLDVIAHRNDDRDRLRFG